MNKALSSLWEIQQRISRVLSKTAGKEFIDYEQDNDLSDIVERNLISISAYLVAIKDTSRNEEVAAISSYEDIMNLETTLVTNYRDIDNRFIWKIATRTLPTLQQEVQFLLNKAKS